MRGAGNIRDVQETILVLVFFVDAAHEGGRGREDLVDEDEDGLLRAELDALANNVDELADGQIRGDQVLLLVDCCNVGFLDLLADDLVQRHRQSTTFTEIEQRGVGDVPGCGRRTSDECVRLLPCASRRGAHP